MIAMADNQSSEEDSCRAFPKTSAVTPSETSHDALETSFAGTSHNTPETFSAEISHDAPETSLVEPSATFPSQLSAREIRPSLGHEKTKKPAPLPTPKDLPRRSDLHFNGIIRPDIPFLLPDPVGIPRRFQSNDNWLRSSAHLTKADDPRSRPGLLPLPEHVQRCSYKGSEHLFFEPSNCMQRRDLNLGLLASGLPSHQSRAGLGKVPGSRSSDSHGSKALVQDGVQPMQPGQATEHNRGNILAAQSLDKYDCHLEAERSQSDPLDAHSSEGLQRDPKAAGTSAKLNGDLPSTRSLENFEEDKPVAQSSKNSQGDLLAAQSSKIFQSGIPAAAPSSKHCQGDLLTYKSSKTSEAGPLFVQTSENSSHGMPAGQFTEKSHNGMIVEPSKKSRSDSRVLEWLEKSSNYFPSAARPLQSSPAGVSGCHGDVQDSQDQASDAQLVRKSQRALLDPESIEESLGSAHRSATRGSGRIDPDSAHRSATRRPERFDPDSAHRSATRRPERFDPDSAHRSATRRPERFDPDSAHRSATRRPERIDPDSAHRSATPGPERIDPDSAHRSATRGSRRIDPDSAHRSATRRPEDIHPGIPPEVAEPSAPPPAANGPKERDAQKLTEVKDDSLETVACPSSHISEYIAFYPFQQSYQKWHPGYSTPQEFNGDSLGCRAPWNRAVLREEEK